MTTLTCVRDAGDVFDVEDLDDHGYCAGRVEGITAANDEEFE